MKRTRYLLAASLACVVAGSGVYLHLMRSPQLKDAAAPVEQKVASNDVAQAPSTVQAKKESESRKESLPQPQTQIQTATEAAKPNPEVAAPSVAAAPPPAKPRMEDQIAGLLPAPTPPPATASRAPMQGAPSDSSGGSQPERSRLHARVATGTCAADGAGRSLARP